MKQTSAVWYSIISVQAGPYGQVHDDSCSALTVVSVPRLQCSESKPGFKVFQLAGFPLRDQAYIKQPEVVSVSVI